MTVPAWIKNHISAQFSGGVTYNDIYAIRGPGDTIHAAPLDLCTEMALPIPLNIDTFWFYLQAASQLDSIRLSYTPEVYYDARQCGMQAKFNRMKSSGTVPTVLDTVPFRCSTITNDGNIYYEMVVQ